MTRLKDPPAWLIEGAVVDYHAVIGGPVTQAAMVVEDVRLMNGKMLVAFLKGKRGFVAAEALSLHVPDPIQASRK